MRADYMRNRRLTAMVNRRVYWCVKGLADEFGMHDSEMVYWLLEHAVAEFVGLESTESKIEAIGKPFWSDLEDEFKAAVDKSLARRVDSDLPF